MLPLYPKTSMALILLAADRDHYREQLLLGTQAQGASPKSGQNEYKSRQSQKSAVRTSLWGMTGEPYPHTSTIWLLSPQGEVSQGPTIGQALHHIHISNIKQTQQFVFIHICNNNNKENDAINLQGRDECEVYGRVWRKEKVKMWLYFNFRK